MLLLDIICQSVIRGILPTHTCEVELVSDWKLVWEVVCLDVGMCRDGPIYLINPDCQQSRSWWNVTE